MIKLLLLIENRMRPIPKKIAETVLYPELQVAIVREGGVATTSVIGDQSLVWGEEENIRTWLDSCEHFWVGVGNPIEQRFEHIVKEKHNE